MTKVRAILSTFLVVLAISATSAFGQSFPKVGTVTPQEVCIIPTSPEITMTAMGSDGNYLNITAVLYLQTSDRNVYVNESRCGIDNYLGEGCFNNGVARFTKDANGNPLVAGDYLIMTYAPLEYEATFADFHAETGTTSVSLFHQRKAVLTLSITNTSARRGNVSFDYSFSGEVPAGTDIYAIAEATGPTGRRLLWESVRKSLSSVGNSHTLSFLAEGAPIGFDIVVNVYVGQKATPTRPFAQNNFKVMNVK